MFITGASSGIGLEASVGLARRGARVHEKNRLVEPSPTARNDSRQIRTAVCDRAGRQV